MALHKSYLRVWKKDMEIDNLSGKIEDRIMNSIRFYPDSPETEACSVKQTRCIHSVISMGESTLGMRQVHWASNNPGLLLKSVNSITRSPGALVAHGHTGNFHRVNGIIYRPDQPPLYINPKPHTIM